MARHAPRWLTVMLLSLSWGCASVPASPVRLDSGGRQVDVQVVKPVRKYRVLWTFRYQQESELAEIRNRARSMGADAVVVSVVRTRQGGGAVGNYESLGVLGLTVTLINVVAAVAAADSKAAPRDLGGLPPITSFVAKAIQWTEESADFIHDASPSSTIGNRLVGSASALRADFEAHPDDEAAFSAYLLVCEQLDDRVSARTAWERFITSSARPNPSHRLGYASWLWSHGLAEEALVQARMVRQATPSPRGAASLLGRLLAARGATEEARAELERALKEDPDDLDASAALERLSAVP